MGESNGEAESWALNGRKADKAINKKKKKKKNIKKKIKKKNNNTKRKNQQTTCWIFEMWTAVVELKADCWVQLCSHKWFCQRGAERGWNERAARMWLGLQLDTLMVLHSWCCFCALLDCIWLTLFVLLLLLVNGFRLCGCRVARTTTTLWASRPNGLLRPALA